MSPLGTRPSMWQDKAQITAGALTALVIVGWMVVIAIVAMSTLMRASWG